MTPEPADLLIVEDNPSDLEFTLRALKKCPKIHAIQTVKDGAEALDFIFCSGAYEERKGRNLPKVILLDLKLPKVNGIEVLKKLRADARTRPCPVVILTSSQEERDITESYRCGANSYIVKPVEFEKFVQAIGHISLYWLLHNKPPR